MILSYPSLRAALYDGLQQYGRWRLRYKSVSQSCAVAKSEKFWWATGQSTWRTNGWLLQKLLMFGFRTHTTHFRQWSSLPFCLPSLIVQRPARIGHFSLLRVNAEFLSLVQRQNRPLSRQYPGPTNHSQVWEHGAGRWWWWRRWLWRRRWRHQWMVTWLSSRQRGGAGNTAGQRTVVSSAKENKESYEKS